MTQLEPDRAARGRDAGQDSSHHQSLFDFITQAVVCEGGLQPLQWQCVSACRQGGQLQLHPTVTQLQLVACSRRGREWVLWGWDTEAVRSLESLATLHVSCLILTTVLELCLLIFFFPQDRIFLCSPGYPGTHSVDQAGLDLRDPPASASRVLGLKGCATTAQLLL